MKLYSVPLFLFFVVTVAVADFHVSFLIFADFANIIRNYPLTELGITS